MIQSFINTVTTLASNSAPVVFQRDCIRTNSCQGYRSWLCHNEGSANYDIVECGQYKINFNATVSSATAGVVAIALYNNGEMIPGTLRAVTLTATGDLKDIAVTKEIRVCCKGNANISVRSVASVPTPTAPETPIATQIPIIVDGNLIIDRRC